MTVIAETNAADAYLSSINAYRYMPGDVDERRAEYAVFQKEWRRLFSRLVASSDHSDPHVNFALGRGYFTGRGVDRDVGKAASLFEYAAERGHIDAMSSLASYLQSPRGGHDYRSAIKWWKLAAAKGHTSAKVFLGFAYRDGRGVTADPLAAANWFIKAFEEGNHGAATHAGRVFRDHLSQPNNALVWFHKAADYGCSDSFIALALLYDDPKSGFYNPAEAVHWYHLSLAASVCVPRSLLALARHYIDGSGFVTNKYIAILFLKRVLTDEPDRSRFRRYARMLLRKIEDQ